MTAVNSNAPAPSGAKPGSATPSSRGAGPGTGASESSNGSGRGFGAGGFSEITSFLWSVADLLRGDYKQADYGKAILPLTVLRRLDCVLEKSKEKVLAKHA